MAEFGYVHLCDQPTVPGQQRSRRDEPMSAEHGWKQPGQRRQDRPVSPIQPGPAHPARACPLDAGAPQPHDGALWSPHFGRQACARRCRAVRGRV